MPCPGRARDEWVDRMRGQSAGGRGSPVASRGRPAVPGPVLVGGVRRGCRSVGSGDAAGRRRGYRGPCVTASAPCSTGTRSPISNGWPRQPAVLRGMSIIAGGPGTGKTTTVARVLALIDEQASAAGRRPPLVALAAPTGKAAARLEEAVKEEAQRLPISAEQRGRLLGLQGQTLHRLLGWSPNHTRFRHHRLNRLAHDVVVVDETSMVSLSLMARLVEAVRPDGRLVLLGDPEQLSSVEAGAVLGDLVGPGHLGPAHAGTGAADADRGHRPGARGDRARSRYADRRRHRGAPAGPPLRRGHRQPGRRHPAGRRRCHVGTSPTGGGPRSTGSRSTSQRRRSCSATCARAAVTAGRQVWEAAREGRATDAIAALGSFRLLCAHRRGPEGATDLDLEGRRLVEDGDRGLRHRGAVVHRSTVAGDGQRLQPPPLQRRHRGGGDQCRGRVVAAFERGSDVVEVSPSRLASVDTVYAMTVHKAQGSQFDTVAVLLPGPDSPILTRELLYTGVTRGRSRVIVAGTEEAIRTAVERPITRSSGLRSRLWGV